MTNRPNHLFNRVDRQREANGVAAALGHARVGDLHGKRRSNDDLRKAIGMLLDDVEWSQWSDREIARHLKCSHPTVAKVRAKIHTGNGYQYECRAVIGLILATVASMNRQF